MNRKLVHAPESTKRCPECGSTQLVRLGTQNVKMCSVCPTDISWVRKPDEPDVYGGPVDKTK